MSQRSEDRDKEGEKERENNERSDKRTQVLTRLYEVFHDKRTLLLSLGFQHEEQKIRQEMRESLRLF